MKVDVLQVEDAKFRSLLSWWSNWVDVAVFTFEFKPYLIQMSVSRTNRKRFRSVSTVGPIYKQVDAREVGDLMPMKGGK